MNGVSRIGHMALRVPDLDAAIAFHAEVLGLVETERRGRGLLPHLQRAPPRADPDRVARAGLRPHRPGGSDPETLERLRRGSPLPAARLIGPTYDGEPGIDRAAFVRGPGGHVYKLFCGMEEVPRRRAGDRPIKFEHVSVKARRLGPTERFLARRPRLPLLRPDGPDRELVALRRRPSRDGGDLRPAARALPLRLDGARPERDGPRRRPARRPRPQARSGARAATVPATTSSSTSTTPTGR